MNCCEYKQLPCQHRSGVARERRHVDNSALSRNAVEPKQAVRTLTALLFLTLLAACADPVEDAKESVKGAATYPRDLEYREIKVVRKDVVCGEFKQSDRWGDSRGFQPFIVLAGDPRLNPSDLDIKVFCNNRLIPPA